MAPIDSGYPSQPATSPYASRHCRNLVDSATSSDFDEEMEVDGDQAAMENRFRNLPNHLDQMHIESNSNPDATEEDQEDALAAGIATVIDLTGERSEYEQRVPTVPHQLHLGSSPRETLSEYMYCGDLLKGGVTIEIPAIPDLYQASFIYIRSIIHEPNRGIFVRGLPMTRTRNLRGRLPRLRNELCLILQVGNDDDRSEEEQALIELQVTKIVTTRTLYFTNADFPDKRYPGGIYQTVDDIEHKGILICRWKCKLTYRHQSAHAKRPPPEEFSLEHLNRKDASSASYRVSDVQRRNVWRGGKTRGGSFHPSRSTEMEFTVDVETEADITSQSDSEDAWIPRQPGQQYTFGDMFCGAGGASCGAEMAGFFIKLSCDNSSHACETYRHRFPRSELWEMDIFEFVMKDADLNQRVDVMHLSPPCQFWSPAHTVSGANDDANIASLFACHQLLNKLRPRVFTLEQTFGILHPRFEHYFNALVHGFTQWGYSMRWKIVDLLIWGCPSRRKRLIMIGSCPGEKLPPFPPPTHSEHPAPGDTTRPYVTVRQVLRQITPATTMQHPTQLCRRPPWDPNIPLQRTITTSGGIGNYHYSGERCLNLREYATLQGFPVDYVFHSSNIKRQIGNAFPPCVVKTIYKHIRKSLWDADRIIEDDDDGLSELADEFEEDQISNVDIVSVDDDMEDDGDLEYLGRRYMSSGARSSSSNEHSAWQQEMDLDKENQSANAFTLCIDANQQNRRTYIDLTGPIDLTQDPEC